MAEIRITEVEYGTKEVIAAELAGLKESYSVLVMTRGHMYWDSLKSFMDVLLNDMKMSAVYVTANKPAAKVATDLEDAQIGTEKVRFIDCVSNKASKNAELSPPMVQNLTYALKKAVGKGGGKRVVVIDSISSLMLYNTGNEVERFVHDLAASIYEWKTVGVMFAVLTDQNASFIETLAPVFDKVIRIIS